MTTSRKWSLLAVAIVCVMAGWWWIGPNHSTSRATSDSARSEAGVPLPVLWNVPSFSFRDQGDHLISSAQLLGRPWIADFIFTRCTSACPIMTAQMVSLQRKVQNPRVRFISFSVDPEHDTPAVLRQYAARWHADEIRWYLLSTDVRGLESVTEGMKMTVQATDDPDDPILHSNRFTLVDAQGRIRGIYRGTDDEQMQRLAADVEMLAQWGSEPSRLPMAANGGANGALLFAELGCAGCHADPRLAPPVQGLYGRTVTLADGRSVTGDEAYITESIVDPTAKVVAGYAATMPSYAWLGEPQRKAIATYVQSLAAPPAASPPRRVVVDPVCKMHISAGDDTPHLLYENQTYYFCSETCRNRFAGEPSRFVSRGDYESLRQTE